MSNSSKLLHQKAFRNFLSADVISGLGVGMTTVGANWYMLSQTHSNRLVGFYLTINVLAGFIMSPIAGIITDKFSRKVVILWTFVVRAIAIAAIAVYFYIAGFDVWAMYLLAIVTGAGWITYMSASRSYVQAVLPQNLFGSANAFIEVSLQVGMFFAGAISGIILNYTGFLVILIINVLVFIIASCLVVTIQSDTISKKNKEQTEKKRHSGIRYLVQQKSILNIGFLSILPLIVTQLFNVSSPDYVSTVLKANSVVYGIADMSYGIGGLVAGILTGFLLNHFHSKKLIILFFSSASLGLILLYLGRLIPLMYLCTFVLGLSNSSLRVIINTVLMSKVKQSFMGRVTSLWNGLAQLIEVFASTLIGTLNDQLGANFGFLIMFLIMFGGVCWSFAAIRSNQNKKNRAA